MDGAGDVRFCTALVDIDHLRHGNYTLGHKFRDRVLNLVSGDVPSGRPPISAAFPYVWSAHKMAEVHAHIPSINMSPKR